MQLLALILVSTVAVNAGAILDYRLTVKEAKECVQAGTMCESCSEVVLCMPNGTEWTKTHVASCNSSEVCVDGECTEEADPFCDGTADLDFPCSSVGVFPDPFYCDKFVICVDGNRDGKLEPHTYQCSQGYGFDIENDLCNVKLVKGQCVEGIYPVPLCVKPGDVGPLAKKDSMYYICEQRDVRDGRTTKQVLYPYVKKCADGQHFNATGCVPL